MHSPTDLRENPQLFIELMERYNIKPRDLGISPAYKSQIKSGYRKPSLALCQRLLDLIREKVAADPSTGPLQGLADLTADTRAAGLTSGFDMRPGVARPLWPGRPPV